MYLSPRPAVMMSGALYSISAYVTPPSASPTPASMRDLTRGESSWQVVHQEVVQRVRRGRREEEDRERYVESSSALRTLGREGVG